MATIAPVRFSRSGATSTFAATASGGDEVTYAGPMVVSFRNDHSSAVSVSLAPTATTINTSAGPMTPATRTQSIAAGASWEIFFDDGNVQPYLNANGRVPFTYTSHNVALVIAARQTP
jgi:hypothetical protein